MPAKHGTYSGNVAVESLSILVKWFILLKKSLSINTPNRWVLLSQVAFHHNKLTTLEDKMK
jgi:hypothetical protein